MKRHLIFDLDGTLIDSMPEIYKAVCNIFTYFKRPAPLFSEYVLGTGNGYYDFFKTRIPELQNREELYSLWSIMLSEIESFIPETFPGADEFLIRASDAGHSLILITANAGKIPDRWLDCKNRRSIFTDIYLASDKKVDVEKVLQGEDVCPYNTHKIGDTISDFEVAHIYGLQFHGMVHHTTSLPFKCLARIRRQMQGRGARTHSSFSQLARAIHLPTT